MYALQDTKLQPKRSLLRLIGTLIALALVIYLVWRNWPGFVDALNRLPLPLINAWCLSLPCVSLDGHPAVVCAFAIGGTRGDF